MFTDRHKASKDFFALCKDTSHVINNLSTIARQLGSYGSEKTHEVRDNLQGSLEDQLCALRESVETLSEQLGEQAEHVKTHVRANPLSYVCGALGVTLLAGYLLSRSDD